MAIFCIIILLPPDYRGEESALTTMDRVPLLSPEKAASIPSLLVTFAVECGELRRSVDGSRGRKSVEFCKACSAYESESATARIDAVG